MARPERDFPGGRDGAIIVYKMDITGRCKLYYILSLMGDSEGCGRGF
jgi:hypothetical protein